MENEYWIWKEDIAKNAGYENDEFIPDQIMLVWIILGCCCIMISFFLYYNVIWFSIRDVIGFLNLSRIMYFLLIFEPLYSYKHLLAILNA